MHRGYTKRWRKRWDKEYHKDILLWMMMDYFIDFANWKKSEIPFIWKGKLVKMVKIERGECFFTYKGLADFLNSSKLSVNRRMVRERIKVLSDIEFLAHQSGHQYQIVRVLNYDKYNPLENDNCHQSDINRPSIAHQSDTPNKDNKVNNKKKSIKKKNFKPPSVNDVIKYFTSNGYSKESAIKAFKYYSEADPPWTDSRGNKVRGWKQKMVANWFRDENKINDISNIQPNPFNGDRFLKTANHLLTTPGYDENDFNRHCYGHGQDPRIVKQKLIKITGG